MRAALKYLDIAWGKIKEIFQNKGVGAVFGVFLILLAVGLVQQLPTIFLMLMSTLGGLWVGNSLSKLLYDTKSS